MEYKDYKEEDALAREDYINSRTDILHKSHAIDVWTRVIRKAKDDIIYYTVLEDKRSLKPEEKEEKEEAIAFLSDDEYKIPFDDYEIIVLCPVCLVSTVTLMSNYASGLEMCSNCSAKYNIEETTYKINKISKEINFSDLLSILGIENVKLFRDQIFKRIETAIKVRRQCR